MKAQWKNYVDHCHVSPTINMQYQKNRVTSTRRCAEALARIKVENFPGGNVRVPKAVSQR